MNADEAYAEAIAAVHELRDSGIRTEIEPYPKPIRASLLEKYSGPERVAPEKWVNVHFYPVTDEQKSAIHEAAHKLGWQSMKFDTGGCEGQRDWELDWSFNVVATPDAEAEHGRDVVEEIIKDGIESGPSTPMEDDPL